MPYRQDKGLSVSSQFLLPVGRRSLRPVLYLLVINPLTVLSVGKVEHVENNVDVLY